jgi:hypothetical protein
VRPSRRVLRERNAKLERMHEYLQGCAADAAVGLYKSNSVDT